MKELILTYPDPHKLVLNWAEAADLLSIPHSTMLELTKDGTIPTFQVYGIGIGIAYEDLVYFVEIQRYTRNRESEQSKTPTRFVPNRETRSESK